MVNEYIERLMLEEQEEIEKLQIQMKKSLNDLQSSQEWLESLQREKNVEFNIFSPRKFDFEADAKIEQAKAAVREYDQNVEYIRGQIESHTKRNQEYLKLQEENELEKINIPVEAVCSEEEKTAAKTAEISSDNQQQISEMIFAEESQQNSISKSEVISFLKNIYKKTEVSLALLNGDKNKCKNEMKRILHEVKEYVSELEKNAEM